MTVIDILNEKFLGKDVSLTNNGKELWSGVVSSIYELGDRYSGYSLVFVIGGYTNFITLDDTEITLN